MSSYQIFTDATADLSSGMMAQLPSVEIIPMNVEIGGRIYTYGPQGDLSVQAFYQMQKTGNYATTSQINPDIYRSYFEPCLQSGKDILYLCFTSGMSGTIQSARLCLNELKEKYPDRTILCVDTLCASLGEGVLVQEAARRQAEGFSILELQNWVVEHRQQVCHWFTVDDVFDHLKHGGRVSSAAAVWLSARTYRASASSVPTTAGSQPPLVLPLRWVWEKPPAYPADSVSQYVQPEH